MQFEEETSGARFSQPLLDISRLSARMLVSQGKVRSKHVSKFPEVSLVGTPYEMGVQYGEKLAQLVRHSVDYWNSQLRGSTEKSRPEMLEVARKCCEASTKYFPELYEEVRGLSKGSGVNLDDIVITTFNNAIWTSREMGCSNFSARGGATKDGEPILGRNLDYDYAVTNHTVIVRAKPEEGNSWLGSRCGAIMGAHEGINEKGIGAAWASVVQPPSERVEGMAHMQLLQACLTKASTVKDAVDIITTLPKSVGANYTVCNSDSAAVVEASGTHNSVRYEEDDIVLGTNHWRTEDMIRRQGPNKADPLGGVFCPRYVYGEKFLHSRSGMLSIADFEEMLSSHGSPGGSTGICQHKDRFTGTVCSSIILPRRGVIYYAKGHPCANSYEQFHLTSAS
jgi:isopenicillin-N N-acyltransferase-like protein